MHEKCKVSESGKLLKFGDRAQFRAWLNAHCTETAGVWLLFGKGDGEKTVRADEALEEALCFGWIDGQMQSIDEQYYKKYFAPRRTNSKWSDKNKALAQDLEARGLMTEFGIKKIEEAKQNGRWYAPKPAAVTDEQIGHLCEILKEFEPAYANFSAMSPSVKKTYAKAFMDAKTENGRQKRLAWIVDRLNKNLKPM